MGILGRSVDVRPLLVALFILLVFPVSCLKIHFEGNVYRGMTEQSLRDGGLEFTVRANFPFFDKYNDDQLREFFTNVFKDTVVVDPSEKLPPSSLNSWQRQMSALFRDTKVEKRSNGRVARIVFPPSPQWTMIEEYIFLFPCFPQSLYEQHASVEGKAGNHAKNCILTDVIALTKIPQVKIDEVRLKRESPASFLVGRAINIPLMGSGRYDTIPYIEAMQGTSCFNTRLAVTQTNRWDPSTNVFHFVPQRGGCVTICHTPFPETYPNLGIAMGNPICVAGPEGVSTDPPQIRAKTEFTGTIYGTDLTERDDLVITSQACHEFSHDTALYPEISLTGSSRALFFALLETEGTYFVCYLCDGSDSFVTLTTLVLEKEITSESEDVVPNIIERKEMRFEDDSSIRHLRIGNMSQLVLHNDSINISSFTWSGGSIEGEGDINVTESATISSQESETFHLPIILRNFGEMVIDVHQLTLEKNGAIHNYGNLTILLESIRKKGGNGIRARNRNNAIVNRGGTIYIKANESQMGAFCQARIVNMEGLLILSGTQGFAEMMNGEKGHLTLRKGARITATEGRYHGLITLNEVSELRLTEDSALVSVTIRGSGSSIVLTGDTYFLDSFVVEGGVTMNIVGHPLKNQPTTVAMYGTNRLHRGTHLNLRRARFVTNTGVVKLHIEGLVALELATVQFIGSHIIHIRDMAIIYGPGQTSSIPRKENLLSAFVVRKGATFVSISVNNDDKDDSNCVTPFAFSELVTIRGRVLFLNCMQLPVGGTISGSVESLNEEKDWAMISSYISRGNVGGVMDDAKMSLLLHKPSRASLILTGEVHIREGANISVDVLNMRGAIVSCEKNVNIHTNDRIILGPNSQLLTPDYETLNSKVVQVDGMLEVGLLKAMQKYDNLHVSPTGTARFIAKPTISCEEVLDSGNGIVQSQGAVVECQHQKSSEFAQQMVVEGDRLRDYMHYMLTPFPPDIQCHEDYLREEANRQLNLLYCFGFRTNAFNTELGSIWRTILGFFCFFSMGALMFFMLIWSWGFTWRKWVDDITQPVPLNLTMTWSELSLKFANCLVILTLITNSVQLMLASFHPRFPLPIGYLSILSLRSGFMIVPHQRFQGIFHVRILMSTIMVTAFLGAILQLQGYSSAMKGWKRGKKHRVFFSVLQRIHYAVQTFFSLFFVPLRSYLLDVLACGTTLIDLPTCKPYQGSVFLAFGALLSLNLVLPWSPLTGLLRPLCELNFKMTSRFGLQLVIIMQIAMWKVFYNRPFLFAFNNVLFQACRVIYYRKANISVYTNINRFVFDVAIIPLMVEVCTFLHLVRVKLGMTSTCRDGELYFTIVLVLAVLGMLGSLWFNIINAESNNASTGDPAIDAIHSSIEQIRSRIEELKYELLTCATQSEREGIFNATTRLRMELLEKQEKYCLVKSRYLSLFYCGDAGTTSLSSSLTDGLSSREANGSSVESFLKYHTDSETINSVRSSISESENVLKLTQEDFESFRCGPALGSGSYGVVHLGILRSGKLVAVKYIGAQNTTGEALERVKSEVNMMKELSHPNIIQYYGCYTAHGYVMLFMEFAVAGSLASIVKKFSGLSEGVIRLYTHQVLCGLNYLHEKGIVHRDIKGQNILVDGYGVVKLADFGCSKELANLENRSNAGCETLTGSPFWMAPEVIRNEAYGTKADIWSVGCTVVELLNGGEPPWREEFDNVYSAMFYVGSTDSIPNIREDASDACRDFLKQCFHRDVAKRPSARELLKHAWLSEGPSDTESLLPISKEWVGMKHNGDVNEKSSGTSMNGLSSESREKM